MSFSTLSMSNRRDILPTTLPINCLIRSISTFEEKGYVQDLLLRANLNTSYDKNEANQRYCLEKNCKNSPSTLHSAKTQTHSNYPNDIGNISILLM